MSTDTATPAPAGTNPSVEEHLHRYAGVAGRLPTTTDGQTPERVRQQAGFLDQNPGHYVNNPQFIAQRISEWADVTRALGNDPGLIAARRDWDSYSEEQKLQVAQKISEIVSERFGVRASTAAVVLADGVSGGGYQHTDVQIEIAAGNLDSFDTLSSIISHETIHRDQDVMIDMYREDPTSLPPHFRDQARLFSIAREGMIAPGAVPTEIANNPVGAERREYMLLAERAYRANPLEAEPYALTGSLSDWKQYNKGIIPQGTGQQPWFSSVGNPEEASARADQLRALSQQILAQGTSTDRPVVSYEVRAGAPAGLGATR